MVDGAEVFRIQMMLEIKMERAWSLNAHLFPTSSAPFFAHFSVSVLSSFLFKVMELTFLCTINLSSCSPMPTPTTAQGETFNSMIQGMVSSL